MKSIKKSLLPSLLLLAIAPSQKASAASLIGQTLGYQYLFPDTNSVYYNGGSVAVGSGVEIPQIVSDAGGIATMDISENDIYIDYFVNSSWTSASFNGFRLFDSLGTLRNITSVTINPGTNMGGFAASAINFDADNIYVNWAGLSFNSNTVVSLHVVTTNDLAKGPALLKVDFNNGASSPTKAGWQPFAVITGAASQSQAYTTSNTYTTGSTTVTLAGSNNLQSRDRAVPSADTANLTLSEVYRDFATADTLTLTLSGLIAGTEYAVTFYSYDNAATLTTTYTNTTGGAQPSLTEILVSASNVTADGHDTMQLNAIANASGVVSFSINAPGGTRLNGIEVNAVPEPGTYALLALSGLGLFLFRRRLPLASRQK